MRLYHQPGLSNRVVSALRNRLERVLADGDARVHGNGAHGEEGDEHRGRSRSRGRAATEAHGSPGLNADGGPGAEIPPLEALLGEAEKSALMVSNALAKSIGDCASKLTTLTEDLGLAVENVSDARKELSKGFSELREQLKAQTYGTTAVTGAVSHQSAEIVKLLKAFDKFSHAGKWALSGSETIENNVKAVREEIKTQGDKLGQCLQGGFEEVSRHLKELVRVMGTPEGIHRDTPETPDMGAFFPPNPPVNPPGMVGPTETAAAPASGPPMPAAPASGYPLQWIPNACGTCQWIPNACGTCQWTPNACSTCQWTSNACGSRCGAAPAANVTGFFAHGLLPRASRWTASRCPDGYFNSQSENWDSHEGPRLWRFTNAFTHSLSWRPGFSHYGSVGPEWTWHAERRQAAVPPYLLEGQEWLEHSQRSSIECCERDPFPVL